MSIFSTIFGDANEKYIKSVTPLVQKINTLEPEFEKIADEDFKKKTEEFRKRVGQGESLDDILPEVFALVREAAKRTLGQRHFDVQLIGGIVLHQGKIAEMKTGEGKTLVATLPLYLNSLAGRGAHLVTPNDYLSRIGAGWMGPIYHKLGVKVGVIANDFSAIYDPDFTDPNQHGDERLNHFRPVSRREAYEADITYGTNNEFGFDYLRDNLEYLPSQLRQRGYYYAIVDEIDSILIDEARTPLIISAPDEESAELYKVFAAITPRLKEGVDYNVDEKLRAVTITEEGINKVESMLGVGNIYEEKGLRFVRHLEQALRAQALYHRDRDYVVRNGEVIIVDEFTGRLMPGRRWSEGLHQAIEAKEGVEVKQESRTLATITFQNYFRMYEKLAGMTGTAQTSAEEFHKVYGLDVITVPTNKPVIRKDLPDLIFRTERGKFMAVAREVKERHQRGQPVLIGTVSIAKNEKLSEVLRVAGIPHQVLNAKNHEREALIIAQAGKKGAVTVATNMAGRGVDIILGGNPPDPKEAEEVRQLGGLHVIGTERHEARRIDNQLRGRAGRQGDPGSSQFFVSMEDDLMRIFAPERIKRLMESLGVPEDQPIENSMVSRALESAQARIEGFHFDARKHVLEYDDVLNKQREAIYRMRRDILLTPAPEETDNADNSIESRKLKEQILEMIEKEVEFIVNTHTVGSKGEWDLEEIFESIKSIVDLPDSFHFKLEDIASRDVDEEEKRVELIRFIVNTLEDVYNSREKEIGARAMYNTERVLLLRTIDMLWMDHLDQMAHLRDSVRLRAYGQRDPLVEYKHEGGRLFKELQAAIRSQVVANIFKFGGEMKESVPTNRQELRPDAGIPQDVSITASSPFSVSPSTYSNATANPSQSKNSSKYAKVGRNDPCPCGSGKKFKKCHGK